MFCYFGVPFGVRLALIVLSIATAGWLVRQRPALLQRMSRFVRRAGARPGFAPALVFVVSLAVNLLFGAIRFPYPSVHDEWAYLLAGDTYASGRLTNPAHEHWEHFETFHVLSQPTYMAKYPPAGGLVLALGQAAVGQPIAGVWFVHSLALAALCWMLQAWVRPRWALAGSLLLAINAPMVLAWGQTYWGGSAALLGGSLLFGSVRRIARFDHRPEHLFANGIALGTGAVVLALSRPFEGLVACLVAGTVLIVWLVRVASIRGFGQTWSAALQLAVPGLIIGGAGLAFLLVNNRAVTGNALTLPYSLHSRQYGATSMSLWSTVPDAPEYRLPRMKSYYVNFSQARQREGQTVAGFVALAKKKLGMLASFFPFLGGICLLPAMVRLHRDGWLLLSAAVVAALVVISLQLVHSYTWPHYLAPVTVLFYVIAIQGLRSWRVAGRRFALCRAIFPAAVVYSCLHLLVAAAWMLAANQPSERQLIEERLTTLPGQHLVFVDYPLRHNLHDEWVWNRADIDGSRIVWANRLSAASDRQLVAWYGTTRHVWMWRVGQKGTECLQPWRPLDLTATSAGACNPSPFAATESGERQGNQ